MIPGSANPLLLKQAAAGGYQIERSLRFNSSDSAYLSRTPASAGNRKTWTWAGWVKRSSFGSNHHLMRVNAGLETAIRFRAEDNCLMFYTFNGSSNTSDLRTTAVFRDPSAWFHVLVAVDTTQATASNRVKFYINGTQQTDFSVATYPSQNLDTGFNQAELHALGAAPNPTEYFSGYLADIHFIDGQALDPTSFGEFDANGVWQPKAYTGSYGTNGFHLPFSDNSTAAALGTDTSGNGNDWTTNNLSNTNGSSSQTGVTSVTTNPYSLPNGWFVRGGGPSSNPYAGRQLVIRWSSTTIYDGAVVSGPYSIGGATYAPGTRRGDVYGWSGDFSSCYDVVRTVSTTSDSLVDTPTSYGTDTGAGGEVRGNYATLNPLDGSPSGLSNGNLDAASANAYPTIIPGSGSWYYEVNGTGYTWDGTRANWTPRAGSHNFGQRAWVSSAPSGFKALCDTNLPEGTITTSGTFTGNANADGPFVWLNGVPTAMSINGNAVTFGTHADKLANGFKLRTNSTSYNTSGSNTYSITSTGAKFKYARAQSNP